MSIFCFTAAKLVIIIETLINYLAKNQRFNKFVTSIFTFLDLGQVLSAILPVVSRLILMEHRA
jgi:DNA replication protein DnaC